MRLQAPDRSYPRKLVQRTLYLQLFATKNNEPSASQSLLRGAYWPSIHILGAFENSDDFPKVSPLGFTD
jgi:hypothetical protein